MSSEILPNSFIVGAARCGTTAVYRYLLEHPDVFVPRERKELGWFSKEGGGVGNFDLYCRLFEPGGGKPCRVDVSTGYLYIESTPLAIRSTCGEDIRIVVFVRNPVDAALSLWQFQVAHGHESLDFLCAVEAEPSRRANPAALSGWVPNFFYVDRYRYAPQVMRFIEVFGADRVRVIVFERFFGDILGGWRDLCEFLGIDPLATPVTLGTRHNQSGRQRSNHVARMLADPPSVLRRAARALLPPALTWKIISSIDAWNITPGGPVVLPPEQRATIRRLFADDIAEMSRVTGIDLENAWQ